MTSIAKLPPVLLAAMAIVGVGAPSAQARWVESWQAAPNPQSASPAAAFANVTLTQLVRISHGGGKVRVRFTNRYGAKPLEIGSARIVRVDDAGRELPGTARALTFAGRASARIPSGASFLSDAVDLAVPDLARLKIEFFLPEDTGTCTCHSLGLEPLSVSPPGNFVGKAFTPADTRQVRAFVEGVEIDSSRALGTIVAFGDSITDGYGSSSGKDARWPDALARRLHAAGKPWALANAGISGNRVLAPGMGDAALSRFDADVLSLPGVKYLVLFEGVNDIGMSTGPDAKGPPVSVEAMKAGYLQLVARAHAHGIKVIASPIAPYKGSGYWSEQGEAVRAAINAWILSSGAFDAIVRFDTALADPADPQRIRADLHSGDHLHGNDKGYEAMARALDLSLFTAR
ncbi:SGNH/GDSL hydrolase family protein [Novosphingobium profundi]|uniref:SGNH/GDSL hydrolase family protein n=1 Tax=Novosphingobium profundi TaxID=1774954 RepID=UPI001BDAD17C|nr:SGNH/GDSL hydrolase family protein [Novosphingobium profundi]MBT0670079.1 SGNH/GDSL hydrolase family protein [Novosphingobium profundi]